MCHQKVLKSERKPLFLWKKEIVTVLLWLMNFQHTKVVVRLKQIEMTNLIQNMKIPIYIFVAKSIMHNFCSTFKLVVCHITHCFEPEYIILVHLCLWNKRQTCEKMFKSLHSTQSVFKGLIFQSYDVFGICTARNYMTSNMRINTIKVQYFYITVTLGWEGGTWN